MGEPEVAGEGGKYRNFTQRWERRDEVDAWVAEWTGKRTRDEVLAACETGQVPAGPVYAIDEIFDDPHYAARENMVSVEDARLGTLKVANVVPRLTKTPGKVTKLGASLGQHNAEIYGKLLDLGAARLKGLAQKGVV